MCPFHTFQQQDWAISTEHPPHFKLPRAYSEEMGEVIIVDATFLYGYV